MKRHTNFFIESLKTVTILTALSFAGCTTKSASDVAVAPVDTNSTQTIPMPQVSPTNTSTNSNLFDTSTTSDVAPTTTTNTTTGTTTTGTTTATNAPYGQASQYCLNGIPNYSQVPTSASSTVPTTTNTNQPFWYGQQNTGLSTACIDPSASQYIGNATLMNWGIQSFGSMQSCYESMMAKAPQFCSQGMDATMIFKMSRMAMVRCYRNILRQQMALVQWAPEQTQSYQTNDSSLYSLLQQFSQQH